MRRMAVVLFAIGVTASLTDLRARPVTDAPNDLAARTTILRDEPASGRRDVADSPLLTSPRRFAVSTSSAPAGTASIPTVHDTEAAAADPVNGSLETIGSHRVLNLWGSNYEMGYAHGYLMADKIRTMIDTFMIGYMAGGSASSYKAFLAEIPLYFVFYPKYEDEIAGMVAGMIASGKSLYVSSLGRNIDARDIRAFSLWPELSYGCTSFGVWGKSTANQETIVARNLDWTGSSAASDFINEQILITYEPAGGPRFLVIAWPGFFGLASGLNEYGISVMPNVGNGAVAAGSGPWHPSAEVFRAILESTTSSNYLTQPLAVVDSAPEYSTFSVQIGSPYTGSANPVYYVEDGSTRNVNRYASDSNPGYDHIIASNHFLKLMSPPYSGDSVTRYNSVKNGLLSLYQTGDRTVDSQEAFGLLRGAAQPDSTMTSVVIRPNRMEFDLSFAKITNGSFTPSTSVSLETHAWASLFPNHDALPATPDLAVQSVVAVPANALPGQSVAVTVTARNQGGASAGAFQVDLYTNLTTAPVPMQVGTASCVIGNLAAGASDRCTFTVAFPSTGAYNLWAQVDTAQVVSEISETNNVFGPLAVPVGYPDLTISALSAPASVSACQSVAVADTTKNLALFSAGSSVTKLYWSSDSRFDAGDSYLASRAVGALAGGASTAASTSVVIPCGVASGSYYIVGRADADGVLAESDETNNERSAALAVVVAKPDLTVSALSAPTSAGACQTVYVTDTTRNTGNASSGASITRFYWSTDATYSAGDASLAPRTVKALAAGASSSGGVYVKVPCGTARGTYYIIGKADADGAIGELSEANNTRAKSITVR
jgi:hypothetical protein